MDEADATDFEDAMFSRHSLLTVSQKTAGTWRIKTAAQIKTAAHIDEEGTTVCRM